MSEHESQVLPLAHQSSPAIADSRDQKTTSREVATQGRDEQAQTPAPMMHSGPTSSSAHGSEPMTRLSTGRSRNSAKTPSRSRHGRGSRPAEGIRDGERRTNGQTGLDADSPEVARGAGSSGADTRDPVGL